MSSRAVSRNGWSITLGVPMTPKLWLKVLVAVIVTLALMILMQDLIAATVADEFQAATNKITGWVAGNVGKLGATLALGLGSIYAAIRKDWTTFFGAVGIAILVGVVLGVINASFGATLAI
jgi:conjugal transfer pilus assembly protein TraA